MNKQKFVQILRAPEGMSESDLVELEALTKENPYFQSGHIVVARGSRLLKSPSSSKKVNTAAIYATNRAILKHYMQGNVSSKPVSQPKTTAPDKPKSQAPIQVSEKQKISSPQAPAPAQEKKDPPAVPRKAPEQLSKSDHDLLIDDIYANLEKWKESRDHYLEYEKITDEPELSTRSEDLEDAVEKIKNQIAEEVIAEDKEVTDQIEKIGATKIADRAEEPSVEIVESIDETSNEVSEIGIVEEDHVAQTDLTETQDDEISADNTTPVPEEVTTESDEANLEQVSEDEIEITEKDEAGSEEDKVDTSEPEMVESEADEEQPEQVLPSESDTAIEETVDENITSVEEDVELVEEETVPESIELEPKQTSSSADEAIDSVEEVVLSEDVKEIDLSDDNATSKMIDEEVKKAEAPVEPVDEVDVDSKLESLNKEKESLHLKPAASKSGKKFRLSILKKPIAKKSKVGLKSGAKTKESEPVSKKETTEKKIAAKKKEAVSADSKKKPAATKKTTKSVAKKTSTTKKSTEEAKPEKKTTKKTPAKKFKLGTSIASKATKKVVAKKSKSTEDKPVKKKAVTQKKADDSDEKKKAQVDQAKKSSKESQSSIVDSFLKANPSISIDKNAIEDQIIDLSEIDSDFPEEAITENLAVILENQDKNGLAIQVYEKLILKNPKKKAYFASQIQKIKKK